MQHSHDLRSAFPNKIENPVVVDKTAPNFLLSYAGQFALRCSAIRVSRNAIEGLLESRRDKQCGTLG